MGEEYPLKKEHAGGLKAFLDAAAKKKGLCGHIATQPLKPAATIWWCRAQPPAGPFCRFLTCKSYARPIKAAGPCTPKNHWH